jgi:hypothetical protein
LFNRREQDPVEGPNLSTGKKKEKEKDLWKSLWRDAVEDK